MGTHDGVLTYRLGTGVLDLAVDADLFGPDLFRVAERINPKRSFLFVSTVLGRHIPVRPRDHFAAVNGIVDQIPVPLLGGPVLVLGYAETAVGIGAAVARRIFERRPDVSVSYISTTRHPIKGQRWVGFSEAHSHATAHHVMDPPGLQLRSGGPVTLVLVDDETTTGSTFAALFGALRDGGLPIGRVLLLTFTDWSAGAAVRAISDLAPDLLVGAFSLMRGRWTWERDPAAALPVVPGWAGPPGLQGWEPDLIDDPLRRAPRLGLRLSGGTGVSQLIERLGAPAPGGPVLVIGTGEHVWGPMLLAEGLEQAGADVKVVATTRSPILMGDVVCHKVTFPDHFGVGVPMYLHNVPARPDVRVILMTETGANGVCPQLRYHLGRGQIVDGDGLITEFGAT
jgi:hypothetical protein